MIRKHWTCLYSPLCYGHSCPAIPFNPYPSTSPPPFHQPHELSQNRGHPNNPERILRGAPRRGARPMRAARAGPFRPSIGWATVAGWLRIKRGPTVLGALVCGRSLVIKASPSRPAGGERGGCKSWSTWRWTFWKYGHSRPYDDRIRHYKWLTCRSFRWCDLALQIIVSVRLKFSYIAERQSLLEALVITCTFLRITCLNDKAIKVIDLLWPMSNIWNITIKVQSLVEDFWHILSFIHSFIYLVL